MDVTVSALPSDVHSGQLGGGVPNVIHYVAQCIASFKDPVTNRITIPHFYDDVIPDDSFDDTTAVAKEALKTIRDWGNMPHDPPNYFDQIWFQPTLDCHGITSGFTEDGTKTVIPATASFKCSARLVNGQCPETMQRLIATYITDFFPDHFTVTVTPLGPLAKPMSVPLNDPYFQCAKDAVQATHGTPPIIQGEGGSIPILAEIQATINRPVILIGMNAPNDNIHAPNERFKQTDYHDGIITYIHLIDTINAITH